MERADRPGTGGLACSVSRGATRRTEALLHRRRVANRRHGETFRKKIGSTLDFDIEEPNLDDASSLLAKVATFDAMVTAGFDPLDAIAGRRKLAGFCPMIVMREGKPWVAVGSPGGHTIVQTVPRTVNTGLGAVFILMALAVLGGDSLTDFALLRSSGTSVAEPPLALILSSSSSRPPTVRATATTCAPACASSSASAAPMPREAPVTSAIRSERGLAIRERR
jgi:hypothetical protein